MAVPAEAERLLRFFDGTDLSAKQSLAAYLVTLTPDRWPHAAMISAGELLLGQQDARLALWADSRTTQNVAREGQALLLIVLDGAAYRARLALRDAAVQPLAGLRVFVGTIAEIAVDHAPYAVLEDGLRFRLREPVGTLERWERVLHRLRDLAS